MKEAGVSRKCFYSWMKDKRFVDYLNSQLDQYTDGELVDIWRALINQAKRGSFQHIKLFFEMKGQYVEKKEVNLDVSLADLLKKAWDVVGGAEAEAD